MPGMSAEPAMQPLWIELKGAHGGRQGLWCCAKWLRVLFGGVVVLGASRPRCERDEEHHQEGLLVL